MLKFSQKIDYNIKFNEIENKITTDHDDHKHVITQEFDKWTIRKS